ncbi:spore germination protein [Paenibacillus sp. Root444D2]|uniref:spore germination protein n=1 Tax=Paenibacillus sp. Root444D2 TaxID=1736538 RepID=UPI000ACDB711|nr:spore germination protein [Paenibacillus sp. Root444D2]
MITSTTSPQTNLPISQVLSENEDQLKYEFRNCSDIQIRALQSPASLNCLVVYTDGLIDAKLLEQVLIPSISSLNSTNRDDLAFKYKEIVDLSEVTEGVLEGKVVILLEGQSFGFLAELSDYKQRSVEEPTTEASIRGPREGFTESLRTNTSLIRRKIKSTQLKFQAYEIGTTTKTPMVLVYMEGYVIPEVLAEARKRINNIHTDRIFDSAYVEEFIEDHPMSVFPQILNTERPDTVAASLMEGKVALIVDGSPNALIIPMTFWSGFQSAEDHYERFIYVSAVRCLRILLVFLSIFLPSVYVALTTFHPQMIPLNLMMSIAASREGLPFPTVVETLLMEMMFEGLREAGLRLPKAIGSAVSIVGALVIGEAAVQAGFISAPIVMIVAGTGIASFAFPRYSLALPFRLLRFPMLIAGGLLGIYGVAMGIVFILIHLVTLNSFGVPYLKPIAPFTRKQWKDTLIRMHHRFMK